MAGDLHILYACAFFSFKKKTRKCCLKAQLKKTKKVFSLKVSHTQKDMVNIY